MKVGSLFTGVGILDATLRDELAADIAWQVEIEEYPRKVLGLRFPEASQAVCDVTSPGALSLPHVDVMAGGFPCQDLSVAGSGAGLEGARSGLFFRMADIIEAVQPRAVLIENVSALQRRGLGQVTSRLHELGYHVEATRIAASDLGAPHKRMRLLLVAYRGGHLWPVDGIGGTWARLRVGWSGTVTRWRASPLTTLLWGTPLAPDTGRSCDFAQGGTPLSAMVRTWATPTVKGNHNRAGLSPTSGDGLATQVSRWPAPVATDYKGAMKNGQRRGSLPEAMVRAGTPGPLNPAWEECLMGWPIGWTDLTVAEPRHVARPLPPGPHQHPGEPPRMVEPRSVKHRPARVKAVGNGVDWDVAIVGARRIRQHMEKA